MIITSSLQQFITDWSHLLTHIFLLMFLENFVLAAAISTIDNVRTNTRGCGFVSIEGRRNLRELGPSQRAYVCHLIGSSLSLLEV
ncbi:hypothetical protein J3E68DRAFT_416033 [Trichoderma sp. SZMC 28012]